MQQSIRYSLVQVERCFKSRTPWSYDEILYQDCYYRISPTMPYTALHALFAEFQTDTTTFIQKTYISAIADDMRRHNCEVAYTVWKETTTITPSSPSDPSERQIDFEYVGIWDNEQSPPIMQEYHDPGEYTAWPP